MDVRHGPKMSPRVDTMLVCETEPACACSGIEFDCQCEKVTGNVECSVCGARLVRIETDSGRQVA